MLRKTSLYFALLFGILTTVVLISGYKVQNGTLTNGVGSELHGRECLDTSADRGKELCAAWAAADAGAAAARWAFWQMILSGLGFGGLLVSLHFTRQATIAAGRANKDAADSLVIASRDATAAEELVKVSQANAERQLRAYIEVEKVDFIPHSEDDEDGKSRVGFRIQINNYGNTPASDVILNTKILCNLLGKTNPLALEDDTSNVAFIAPKDHCGFRIFFWLPLAIAAQVRDGGNMKITLKICVDYNDVFGVKRHIKCAIERANKPTAAHVEGSRSWS